MRERLKIKCPKCGQEIEVLFWNYPGTREIPPEQDLEIVSEHGCEFTDEEWNVLYNLAEREVAKDEPIP